VPLTPLLQLSHFPFVRYWGAVQEFEQYVEELILAELGNPSSSFWSSPTGTSMFGGGTQYLNNLLAGAQARGIPINYAATTSAIQNNNTIFAVISVDQVLVGCGFVFVNGGWQLYQDIYAMSNELAAMDDFDITVPKPNDTPAIAYGRQCVANASSFSLSSKLNQCLKCCSDGAANGEFSSASVAACQVPCNAEYNSVGFWGALVQ